MPISITYRFLKNAKGSLYDFMVNLEGVLEYMANCASMIMERADGKAKTA